MDNYTPLDAFYDAFRQEYMRLSCLGLAREDGASFNMDGSRFNGPGLALGVTSQNVKLKKVFDEHGWAYVERYMSALAYDNMKVGLFKFEGRMEASIDITAIISKEHCSAVLEFARFAGQHSLYDFEHDKLIETGCSGKEPLEFSPVEVVDISKSLAAGRVPGVALSTAS